MKTQIWISICVYVLVAIVKKQLKSEKSLYRILSSGLQAAVWPAQDSSGY